MKAEILITLNDNLVGKIDGNAQPELWLKVFEASRGSTAAPAPAAAAAKRGLDAAERPKIAFDVRKRAGRHALDQAVLASLDETWKRAGQLRQHGVSPAQLRASLARLIEDGLVEWRGQARGTEYRTI